MCIRDRCLCLFHGQAVVGCISWVEADDILMALNITMLGVLTILAAVSYTHLDVYKRQAYWAPTDAEARKCG